jgi:hypothetical protein
MEDVIKARFVEVAENLLKVHLDVDGKVLDKKICKTAIINALGEAYEQGLQMASPGRRQVQTLKAATNQKPN